MITAQRAQEFDIEPQRTDEHAQAFRERVSGILRAQGHIIEAHEALRNRLYDDDPDGDIMEGITGALAMMMSGKHYNPRSGSDQVGDDIAVGSIVRDKQANPPMSPEMMLIAMLMAG